MSCDLQPGQSAEYDLWQEEFLKNRPVPFEVEDPELGKMVAWHCQQPPTVQKRLNLDEAEAVPAPGNNEPCPCGSGKKYKKCCKP